MATTQSNFNPAKLPAELTGKWGWFVALGVALIILGGIAFGNLVLATVVSVYYVGIMMLVAGIIEIIHAFGVKTWGSFFFWLLSGLLYAAAGIVAFTNPILAAGVLTFLLAAALIGAGLFRIWMGFKSKPAAGWGWIVAAGVITALAGLVIAIQWPVNSLFILGLFLAIDLIFQGWSFIAFGLGIKR
ncbi:MULTISPECIES: HdeD family acid-resistance protein [Brucella/Ochrobactrum group]|uniref:HdeD family acid-resistance protein n=1 Tax=Brucella/Ochrobactrum group TaxID=2826938 RepID=UPI001654E1ED|nr:MULTISPECIES: HdeD family acid-resistance protein [Brucella/Ochrobactrum group]MBC8716778.1 HdeD family acid-resistance protein [Ochrobactrum sp. Marseille-Q0166]